MSEKRTCKTCHQFGEHVNYCHLHDSSHAEWDTCPAHETYEEFEARAILEHGVKKDTIEAIEIVLTLHYVEGDMTEKEALDEICHLVHPESRPSSEVNHE